MGNSSSKSDPLLALISTENVCENGRDYVNYLEVAFHQSELYATIFSMNVGDRVMNLKKKNFVGKELAIGKIKSFARINLSGSDIASLSPNIRLLTTTVDLDLFLLFELGATTI
jgi:hypothetical protein